MNPKIAVVWAMVPLVWTLAVLQVQDGNQVVVSRALFFYQHIVFEIVCFLVLIAKACCKVELTEPDAVLGEYGVNGLLDVVVGIGGESALFEHIVSVGEGFFRTDDEVSFA